MQYSPCFSVLFESLLQILRPISPEMHGILFPLHALRYLYLRKNKLELGKIYTYPEISFSCFLRRPRQRPRGMLFRISSRSQSYIRRWRTFLLSSQGRSETVLYPSAISPISFSSLSYTSCGIACLKERSSPLFFTAFRKHSSEKHRYAPLPFFLPVVSVTNSPSSVRRIRISSFFGFISPQPTHFRMGIFFFPAKQPTPSVNFHRRSLQTRSLLRLRRNLHRRHRSRRTRLHTLLRRRTPRRHNLRYSLLHPSCPSAPCSSPAVPRTRSPVSRS